MSVDIRPQVSDSNLAEYAYEAYMLSTGNRDAPFWCNLEEQDKHHWRMVVVAIYKVFTRQPERFNLQKINTKGAHPLSERELRNCATQTIAKTTSA